MDINRPITQEEIDYHYAPDAEELVYLNSQMLDNGNVKGAGVAYCPKSKKIFFIEEIPEDSDVKFAIASPWLVKEYYLGLIKAQKIKPEGLETRFDRIIDRINEYFSY